jgi:anti-anti-sigma regulatory factor
MDLGIAKDLDRALADAASASRDVTVDLRDAVFIDSAILAGLVKAGKTLRNTQARLKVLVASGSHPEYVLRTVGFGALMDIIVADGTVQS